MAENIRLALKGIWSHKLRSFLTMLGVIIGIASIIAIVSTIEGTNQQILQNLIGSGNNNVTVSLRQGDSEYWMDAGAPAGVVPVSEDQMERIRSLNGVVNASLYVSRSYSDSVTAGANTLSGGSIYGVDANYLSTVGYEVYKGRPFVERDYKKFMKVALLDETAAKVLFPSEDPVGKTMEIRGEPFIVTGVIRKADAFKPVIENLNDYYTYMQESTGLVLVPDAVWPVIYAYDEPQNCVVQARSIDDMSHLGREVVEIMQECIQTASGSEESGDAIAYKAEDLLEKARSRQELSAGTNNLLLWIAAISLIVGGIGVANIMLVSVTERFNEIGLKKALGARSSRILIQFLTEAVVLTSIGGILGVISGIVLSQIISRVSGTPVSISIPIIIMGVAISMGLGVLAGILPSMRAARLNPVEALRRE